MGRFFREATLALLMSFLPIAPSLSEEREKQSPGLLDTARSIISRVTEEAHGFLTSSLGKRRLDLALEFLQSSLKLLLDAVATALNVILQYTTEVLGSTGINAKLPFQKVTPEGVFFVAQWALLALLAYWVMSIILRLVVGVVRQALWLFKVTFAVGTFALILSDAGASAETTALRLAGLACVCVLLGVGTMSTKPNAQLEKKIKMLERRLQEMEKSKLE